MNDKWSLLRLFSVQYNLRNNFASMKQDLLRYGYLIKLNLPVDYQRNVIGVEYDFRKMIEPCIVLHIDKTNSENIVSSSEYVELISKLVGENNVYVYEDGDTDLIIDVVI